MSRPADTPMRLVSPAVKIRRTRQLPVDGAVRVRPGDGVRPTDPVAEAETDGALHSLAAARRLGIAPGELSGILRVKEGDTVTVGQLLAERRGLLGWGRAEVRSPCDGAVVSVSPVTGQLMIAERATPLLLPAYLPGRVVETDPSGTVVIEATVSVIQGIFGVGGERFGRLREMDDWGETAFDELPEAPEPWVLFSAEPLCEAALRTAEKRGVAALVSGAMPGAALMRYVGRTLNPACTGDEGLAFSLILSEGFGTIPMADAVLALLRRMEGALVSINGAVQVRAGVIRPEIIGPPLEDLPPFAETSAGDATKAGDRVRIVRGPYFGQLATIAASPETLVRVASGAECLVYEAVLDSGEKVTIPRVNTEPSG